MTRWTRLSAFTPAVARLFAYFTSVVSCRLGLWACSLLYFLLSSMASAAPVTMAWEL
jgi:hypothetical protein